MNKRQRKKFLKKQHKALLEIYGPPIDPVLVINEDVLLQLKEAFDLTPLYRMDSYSWFLPPGSKLITSTL